MPVDLAVVGAAQAGDRAAVEAVLRALFPVIRRHAGLMLRSQAASEDATQEAMIEIARSLSRFAGRSRIETWALRISHRVVGRIWRRQKRDPLHRGVDVPFDLPAPDRVMLVELMDLLERLPPKQAEAFILMEIVELTAVEAAQVTGSFANTMSSRLRLAKKSLLEV